ncbi:hypothetical protein CCAX7_43020 [Capsulimonas corticalis]|uniref:Uncharacterized protein n=1 Tax=Capsulimonas corticalis TaxID=2219043 RepID=A0A402CXI9_9BACT|nr:hypothetical protein [Capsulimonas corticalis]BDI32251.1 hypothetical protein CCAX7_43020 [Capsulimonas corticalis]
MATTQEVQHGESYDKHKPSSELDPADKQFGSAVAAQTETLAEAEIDARNGLRGAPGRRPVPEDFEDLLTPEGNSGDIVGSDIADSPFAIGETASIHIPERRF